jgi:hypothetical protein
MGEFLKLSGYFIPPAPFFSHCQRIQKIINVLCLYHLFFSLIGSSILLRSKLPNYENISFNRNSGN